jgi:beta-lactamase superfamily II metal-dependent hydrolase
MTLNGMTLTILNPIYKQFNDVNNDAIALRLDDRNFSMVLLSDAQFGAENEMLNHEQPLLRCQVMEAPYYGLGVGTASIGNFMKTLQPQVVVISGGPDQSASSGGSRDPFRRTLQQDGIPYYENYVGGTLRVVSDGSNYSIGYFTS